MAGISEQLKIVLTAQNNTQAAFRQLDSQLNGLRQTVLGVASALAGGLAFSDLINTTRTFGNDINRLKNEIGGTAEQMSALSFIGKSVGLTTDELSTTFGQLSKKIADSATAIAQGTSSFDQWGVQLLDANGQIVSFDEAMRRVKTRFQEIGQGAQGTAFLLEVFGRSGKNLSDFLALSDTEMKEMIATAEQFGLIMDEAGADRLEKFNRRLLRLGLFFEGLKLQLGQFLLPIIEAMIEKVIRAAGFFKALGEAIGRMLSPLKQFIDSMGGVKAVADALLTIGVALAGLAAVGALLALITFLGRLAAAAAPLAAVAGGLVLIVLAVNSVKEAFEQTEDPAKRIEAVFGGVAAAAAGLALVLLPFNAVAAVVVAAFSLIAFAIREVIETVNLIRTNWDTFVAALRTGQLNDIPVFGFFFQKAQQVLAIIDGIKTAFTALGDWLGNDFFPWLGDSIANAINAIQQLINALPGIGPALQIIKGIGGAVGGTQPAAQPPASQPPAGLIPISTPTGPAWGDPVTGEIIHAFSEGGVVTRAMAGIIGERGPEAVIPLDRMGQMGATYITVNVSGNVTESEDALADKVSDKLMRRLMSQRNIGFA